jgi:hypothetical protein
MSAFFAEFIQQYQPVSLVMGEVPIDWRLELFFLDAYLLIHILFAG